MDYLFSFASYIFRYNKAQLSRIIMEEVDRPRGWIQFEAVTICSRGLAIEGIQSPLAWLENKSVHDKMPHLRNIHVFLLRSLQR